MLLKPGIGPACALMGCVILIGKPTFSSPIQIPEVVVEAPRTSDDAISTHSISELEIKILKPPHLAELLKNLGGVQLSDLFGDGSTTSVSLRGFGNNASSNSLILIDGFKLSGVDMASPDLTLFLPEDVATIEIIPGSASVLYGGEAVGGVINIKRKIPEQKTGYGKIGKGNFDQTLYQGAFENKLAQNFSYRLSAQHKTTDNFRHHNALQLSNISGRAFYSMPNGRLWGDYSGAHKILQLPGALSKEALKLNRRTASTPNDFMDTWTQEGRLGFLLAGSHQSLWEEGLSVRQSKTEGILQNSRLAQDRLLLGLYSRLTTRIQNSHTLILGFDMEKSDYALKSPFGKTDATQNLLAAHSQFTYALDPRIKILMGGRYTFVNIRLVDSSFNDDLFVSSLGVQGELFRNINWFVKREDNFRFPKVDEQTFTEEGRRLETQKGVSYEGGGEWAIPSQRIKLSAYRLTLQNEIDFNPTRMPWGANVNLDKTTRDGVLFESDTTLNSKTRFSVQYAWTKARFTKGPFAHNRIPFVAEHTLRCALSYFIPPFLSFTLESQTMSDRYAINDTANHFSVGGTTVWNSTLGYTHKGLNIGLRFDNLTDKSYNNMVVRQWDNTLGFYPSPPRSLVLTVGYDWG